MNEFENEARKIAYSLVGEGSNTILRALLSAYTAGQINGAEHERNKIQNTICGISGSSLRPTSVCEKPKNHTDGLHASDFRNGEWQHMWRIDI